MSQKPGADPLSVRGTFQAKVSGLLRGIDASTVALTLILAALGIASVYAMGINPWGGGALLLTSILGIGVIIVRWVRSTSAREQMDTATAMVRATGPDGTELEVTGQIGNREAALNVLTLIREIYQNRQAPPAPRGEVRAGRPSDPANLREYSGDERQAIIRGWQQNIPEHDRTVLEQIADAQKALIADTTKTEHGESAPIEQPEEPKS